ncbi:MAG: hydrogenase 3 maturation endopeptidase HyCI [Collinsella sp.]|nr:hydrogenase 3 maturation endopeptidase HyCI [Collinsella sp.]
MSAGAAGAPAPGPVGLVLTAGSVLRADDAAGPVLSRRLEDEPLPGWVTFDGGLTPEDEIGAVKRLAPARLVLVDAADMALEPGAVRRLTKADVARNSMFTTHSLPLTILIEELENVCGDIAFIGIQPGTTEFFGPMTPAVTEAVDAVYRALASGGDLTVFEALHE